MNYTKIYKIHSSELYEIEKYLFQKGYLWNGYDKDVFLNADVRENLEKSHTIYIYISEDFKILHGHNAEVNIEIVNFSRILKIRKLI